MIVKKKIPCIFVYFFSNFSINLKLTMKIKLLLLCNLLFFLNVAFAQEKTIEGTVKGEDGVVLPGVAITVKGTTIGTNTAANGKYKISANSGATLVFSFVGMVKQSILVGNQSTINVTLISSEENLEEVVVTAQGQGKDKRTLGYATQTVNGAECRIVDR